MKRQAHDLLSGLVVYFVALPLCLGVALASNAPLVAGIMAGIIGGIVVGLLSGSQTSVSGPAAGLAAVVATQIALLGSYQAFLVAVVLAGLLQIGAGLLRQGYLASFFPSSVIKGLLAAIGVLLVLKQIPHLLGHDPVPFGDFALLAGEVHNPFTRALSQLFSIHPGAVVVGLASIALMVGWQRVPRLKNSGVPVSLVVVHLGVLVNLLFGHFGSSWLIGKAHLVQVPVAEWTKALATLVSFPDWSQLGNPRVYVAGVTIAVVASLETLLNLEAVDRIDPRQRHSPPNRELLAQGVGNMLSGLLGGLPITSVIVRSSVNIQSGNHGKLSTVAHGAFLLVSVVFAPRLINTIPLACLAAILIMTGLKLASPQLLRQMWAEGYRQFLPFAVTVAVIVVVDLLIGILLGLIVTAGYVLYSNFRRPLRRIVERHIGGDVLRVELANQVGFLNRAAIAKTLRSLPDGAQVLLDARNTVYIDRDVLDLIDDFRLQEAPVRNVGVSLLGFKPHYAELADQIEYVDFTSRELQESLTPQAVLAILRQGHQRFLAGQSLTRDLLRQVRATRKEQAPLAVVVSCIDSRTPAEAIFDLGIGDIFSVRLAGNVLANYALGSIEYACALAGAKLIVMLGHTSCGAVTSAVGLAERGERARDTTDCENIDGIVEELQRSLPAARQACGCEGFPQGEARTRFIDQVARQNVLRTMALVPERSKALAKLLAAGSIGMVGGLYDVNSGELAFFDAEGHPLESKEDTSKEDTSKEDTSKEDTSKES